jgi:hypothetical protein
MWKEVLRDCPSHSQEINPVLFAIPSEKDRKIQVVHARTGKVISEEASELEGSSYAIESTHHVTTLGRGFTKASNLHSISIHPLSALQT